MSIPVHRCTMIASAAAALLAACTVGPDYVAPKAPAPERYAGMQDSGEYAAASAPGAALAPWWQSFHDATLDRMIAAAIADNLDIQTATWRLAQARAQVDEARGRALPAAQVQLEPQRVRIPENLRDELYGLEQQQAAGNPTAPPPAPPPSHLNLFQANFDTSWELDLFGLERRRVQAAATAQQAAIAARRGAVVSTLAELGNDYAGLRATQARIALLKQTIDIEQNLLELTESLSRNGLSSEIDVVQARAQLETTRAGLPLLEAEVKRSIHAIAVLLGREPGAMEEELAADAPPLPMPPQVPVGLPSELLRNRPDIQQAERELASSTAQVGVAVAQRFPSFSLTASTGYASNSLDEFINVGNWTWNLGGTVTAPIFQGGRLEANQRAAEAVAEQDRLQYRKTVLQAFQEVEDSLNAYSAEQRRRASLAAAVDAAQIALDRTSEQYRAGLTSFLSVLDADRSLAQAQDQLAQSEQTRAQRLIGLYKALGGGWQAAEPAGTAASTGS